MTYILLNRIHITMRFKFEYNRKVKSRLLVTSKSPPNILFPTPLTPDRETYEDVMITYWLCVVIKSKLVSVYLGGFSKTVGSFRDQTDYLQTARDGTNCAFVNDAMFMMFKLHHMLYKLYHNAVKRQTNRHTNIDENMTFAVRWR